MRYPRWCEEVYVLLEEEGELPADEILNRRKWKQAPTRRQVPFVLKRDGRFVKSKDKKKNIVWSVRRNAE